MDYSIKGIYTNKKKHFLNNYYLYNDKVYEIEENLNSCYKIYKSTLLLGDLEIKLLKNYRKILVFEKLIFICYQKTLLIYLRAGNLLKTVESKEDIFIGSYGFLIADKTYFIVNYQGECIFVGRPNNILNLAEDGTVFSVDCPKLNADEKTSWDEENTVEGTFSTSTFKSKQSYSTDGECILSYENYKVFKDTAKINDIISCTSIKTIAINTEKRDIKTSCENSSTYTSSFIDCVIVLCNCYVFVICNDFIVRRSIDLKYKKIEAKNFIIHDFINTLSIYPSILFLNCFTPIKMCKNKEIEGFLASLFHITNDIPASFLDNLMLNAATYKLFDFSTILCRVYRLVDDSSKRLLETYIDFPSLTVDQMYFIIIYKLELLEKFISLCIANKRLFYLVELKDFCIKTGQDKMCRKEFLKQGLLIFDYKGLEIFNKIEKEQIESQRVMGCSFTNDV